MPKHPAEILKLASTVNGFAAPAMNPWHIKANYQIFDNAGNAEPPGTFEEFWASPSHFKRIFASPEFNETEFGTDHGLYRTGDKDWPENADFVVHELLIDPIPKAVNFLGFHLKKKIVSIGSGKLLCLTLQSPGSVSAMGIYCFERDRPILRLAVSWNGRTQTEFNDIVLFEGHYIARDARTFQRGKLVSSAHVTFLEPLSNNQESKMAPPSAAVSVSEPIAIPRSLAPKLIVLASLPQYPPSAKISRIQGTVLIDVLVDKAGKVESAQVVSGPQNLRASAVRAIRRWKYQPFLFPGEPLAFHTQVQMTFSLR